MSEEAEIRKPIIPPMPQAPADLIQIKLGIMSEGVIVHHDMGIVEVKLMDLLKYERGEDGKLVIHPDLQEAAQVGIETMIRKYNGIKEGE
jgi:hypothetical protein